MSIALRHPRSELTAAARAIESMQNAKNFEYFEADWRQFLSCLEKVWTKTERACQPHAARFQPWQGKYQALRKKDMLLRYLKQARDADNHSIQDIAELNHGFTGINFVDKNGGHYKKLTLIDGLITHYEGDDLVISVQPPHPVALRVKNNGQWFNPPTSHLKTTIESIHPVDLAILGLAFYSNFMEAVEKEFFPT